MMQLAFDFDTKRDPLTCCHVIRTLDGGKVLCDINGETYTNCHQSIAGEPPHCVWEPIDNSPDAIARRKAWIKDAR